MIYKAKDNEGFVTVPSNNLSPGKSYQAKVYCVQVQDTAQIRSDPTIVDFKTKGTFCNVAQIHELMIFINMDHTNAKTLSIIECNIVMHMSTESVKSEREIEIERERMHTFIHILY